MKLTSQMIKERAAELGIDCIAIGNIERFAGAPKLMAPQSIFPEARSVIAVAMRIPRGTYRGIEEGTHWHNYTFYSYNKLNTLFRPHLSYELCCFIEDHGYEAEPHFPAVPEGNGTTREPVAEGKLPPDVVCSVRVIAAGCGIGEIGYSKVFLTKRFGPRVRLGLIFTDAELEPDPILDTGDICLHCGACVRECPGNAVPSVKDIDKRLEIDYGEYVNEDGGFLPVTLTNTSDFTQSYNLYFEAVDENGDRLAYEDTVYVTELAAGQSYTVDIFTNVSRTKREEMKTATVRLAYASAYVHSAEE